MKKGGPRGQGGSTFVPVQVFLFFSPLSLLSHARLEWDWIRPVGDPWDGWRSFEFGFIGPNHGAVEVLPRSLCPFPAFGLANWSREDLIVLVGTCMAISKLLTFGWILCQRSGEIAWSTSGFMLVAVLMVMKLYGIRGEWISEPESSYINPNWKVRSCRASDKFFGFFIVPQHAPVFNTLVEFLYKAEAKGIIRKSTFRNEF